MNGWTLFWTAWAGLVLASFGVAEAVALRHGVPLTNVIRHQLALREHTPRGRLGRVAVLVIGAAFPVWFVVHLLVPGFV